MEGAKSIVAVKCQLCNWRALTYEKAVKTPYKVEEDLNTVMSVIGFENSPPLATADSDHHRRRDVTQKPFDTVVCCPTKHDIGGPPSLPSRQTVLVFYHRDSHTKKIFFLAAPTADVMFLVKNQRNARCDDDDAPSLSFFFLRLTAVRLAERKFAMTPRGDAHRDPPQCVDRAGALSFHGEGGGRIKMRGWMAHRKYLIFVHACAGRAMIFTPARVLATLARTPPRSDFCLTVPRKEEESDDSYLQIRHKTGERER